MLTKIRSVFLICIMLAMTMTVPDIEMNLAGFDSTYDAPSDKPLEENPEREPVSPDDQMLRNVETMQRHHELASEQTGIISPLSIEQKGYLETDTMEAYTDSMVGLDSSLPIDTSQGWVASNATAFVQNITRLYATNGTFDEGIPGVNENPSGDVTYYPYGWDSTSYSPNSATVQRSEYRQVEGSHIMLENEGEVGVAGTRWQHAGGTEISWYQNVLNAPYAEAFIFSLDYLYLRGPLSSSLSSNFSLSVYIDGTRIWYQNLPDVESRDVWYTSGEIDVNLPGIDSEFLLEVVLEISSDINLFRSEHGYVNSIYATVYVDNVRLESVDPPNYDEVELTFQTDSQSRPVAGTPELGVASIINTSYWDGSELEFSFSANASISFSYTISLLYHRFLNSSYLPDLTRIGASYVVEFDTSPVIYLYTYIAIPESYLNTSVSIYHPPDWENVTVLDSFQDDVSSHCLTTGSSIILPSSILNRLGWWQIIFEAPNYFRKGTPRIYDINEGQWFDEYQFRSGNESRVGVEIGTSLDTPSPLDLVNITWLLPNGTEWSSESVSGGINGVINSSSRILDSSAAGEWQVVVHWSNGSAIAYGRVSFSMVHAASLVPLVDTIHVDYGEEITIIVNYGDAETGKKIVEDPFLNIVANWTTKVSFIPNSFKQWHEATLNTALVNEGVHRIIVNASRPFYDDVSCEIVIYITRLTRLSSPDAPWTSATWGDAKVLTFFFESYDAQTSVWEPVSNTSDVFAAVNWSINEWSFSETTTAGLYELTVNTGSKASGTYLLNISFSRASYQTEQLLLTLIVSPIASTLQIVGDQTVKLDLEQNGTVTLRYIDHNSIPISGGEVTLDDVSPHSGIVTSSISPVPTEPGNYSLSVRPTSPGIYTLRFVSNEENAQPAVGILVIIVNDVATELVLLTAESPEIGLLESYETVFRYEILNHTGIENAQIDIIYSGPSDGLSWTNKTEIGQGNYSLAFTPSKSGTYLITIAASKTYYQPRSRSFFMIVGQIGTELILLNESSVFIEYGDSFNLFLSYSNSTGHGLNGAAVEIVSVTPSVGFDAEPPDIHENGIYSINMTPVETGTFSVLLRASLDNHETQFATFTLTVTVISTMLKITSSLPSVDLNRDFSISLLYETSDHIGLDEAIVSFVNPPTNIDFYGTEDLEGGLYVVHARASATGTYTLIFRASKQNYQNATVSITIAVSRIGSSLTFPNGTSAVVSSGHSYDLFTRFTNSTGGPLPGALVAVTATCPECGLDFSDTTHVGDGYYLIVLSPQESGSYTVILNASVDDHETQFASFTLNVIPRSSFLRIDNGSMTVAIDREIALVMRYQSETLEGISGAGLEILSPSTGFEDSGFTDLGDGWYRIILMPTEPGVYDVIIRASSANYVNATDGITLSIINAPTSLRVSDGSTSREVFWNTEFEIELFYERLDASENVTGAVIELSFSREIIGGITIVESVEGYTIRVHATFLGTVVMTISASKANHTTKTIQYTLTSQEWATQIDGDLLAPILRINRDLQFSLFYKYGEGGAGIINATILVSGIPAAWLQIENLGNGEYALTLRPESLGLYVISISFEKEGFVDAVYEATFEVQRVATVIELLSEPYVTEGLPFIIQVRVIEQASGAALTGAFVQYRVSTDGIGQFSVMTETEEPGIYAAEDILPAWVDVQNYVIDFRVDKEDFQLVGESSFSFFKQQNFQVRMTPVVAGGGSVLFIILFAVGIVKYATKRRREKNLEALAVKKRFEDVSNLLGIIVLHKSSGLSIYSKTLRGGFEEAMVSAFITAITHFRGEFGMDEKHWDYEVIPISDIISAVPTRNLICAFITTTKPSASQEVKMEAFARAVGAMFDEKMASPSSETIDEETSLLFNELFERLLDGFLLKPYIKVQNGDFPRRMKCLVNTAGYLSKTDPFTLDQLARGMASCGVGEAHAYKMIVDAIDDDLIKPMVSVTDDSDHYTDFETIL